MRRAGVEPPTEILGQRPNYSRCSSGECQFRTLEARNAFIVKFVDHVSCVLPVGRSVSQSPTWCLPCSRKHRLDDRLSSFKSRTVTHSVSKIALRSRLSKIFVLKCRTSVADASNKIFENILGQKLFGDDPNVVTSGLELGARVAS